MAVSTSTSRSADRPESAEPDEKRVRRTQAERSETSRRRLLDAAFDLMIERGSLRFTLSDVGERAGYSRGLPSQVFGSKTGLMQDLVQHLITISLELPSITPELEGFHAVLNRVSIILKAPPAQKRISLSLQVLIAEAHNTNSPIREAVASLARISAGYVSKNLRIGVEAGDVRPDINPRAQAILVMSAVHGALRQWLIDPDRIATEDLRLEMLSSVIRSVAVDPEPWLRQWVRSDA